MAGKEWSEDEIKYLKDNAQTSTCKEIANHLLRSVKSVQHKFNYYSLSHKRATVGDIINGWEILEITSRKSCNQNISYAKIISTLGDGQVKEERLTKLTLEQIGWPDRRRPDLIVRNTTHNSSKTRLYRIWTSMKTRCTNVKQVSYADYGGRGITICDDWLNFIKFKDWAESNGYTEELTLDRQDPNGNYCPENCQWSDWNTQIENRRIANDLVITAFDETKSVYKWKNDPRCSISVNGLCHRIKSGWNPERAITQPSKRKKKLTPLEWLKLHHPSALEEYKNQ